MTFRPLHDRILVRRTEAEEKTAGGIIIPDTVKEKPQQGEVIAVGPGARDDSGKLVDLDVKVGDRILFGKWSGTDKCRCAIGLAGGRRDRCRQSSPRLHRGGTRGGVEQRQRHDRSRSVSRWVEALFGDPVARCPTHDVN